MKIGIFGTGAVGRTLGAALADRGHEVMLGTRDVAKKMAEKPGQDSLIFRNWLAKNAKVLLGTFADVAAHGALLINATAGHASVDTLSQLRPADVEGKILIDAANPLGPWTKGPMELFVANTDSLAERIQRAQPGLRVVKALNTVTARLMVHPAGLAGGDHDVFVAGNDPGSRDVVGRFLREEFGWRTVIDLGDLTAARALEMMILVWIRLWEVFGTADFNYKIVR